MPLSIGLIGVAGYGSVHLEQILLLQRSGRVKLCAVTIFEESGNETLRDELSASGCRIYSDYTEMLAFHQGQLDLCCIPTPIHLHAVMAIDCLHAGANVLVEKPLAGSIEECQAIQAAQKETGRLVAVGFQNVYDPSSLEIKDRLLAGEIGAVKRMYGFGLGPRSLNYYNRNNWAGKLQLNGMPVLDSPANNAMAHHLQWLLFVGSSSRWNSLVPASMEAELHRANLIESPDTVNLNLTTVEGVDLRFVVSHACVEKVDMKLVIEGSEGSLVWRQNQQAEFHRNGCPSEAISIPTHREMQMQVVERVVTYLEAGEGFICRPEHAEMHTRCIVAAHDSSAIHVVPEQFRKVSLVAGEEIHHIEGIEDAVRDSAIKNLSFSALGVPWSASTPKRVPVPDGSVALT